ncbi:hypothetical protein CHH57_01765 [Niallia circulans]|uniref:Uncharacterized protein n=1 Tax=Niallia circulans TaxID=1397 RepID=A0AA91TWR8_NIACI|nr:hypothetical protein [Niallia circulans]PAD85062.1 hypothetical protein CHH57_01765 [Niallia circulans]
MNIKMNEIELKQVYTYNKDAITSLDYANNLACKHGLSSWNSNEFEPELTKMVKKGIVSKIYDFVTDGFREALYEFQDGNQITFHGENHMKTKLYYNY